MARTVLLASLAAFAALVAVAASPPGAEAGPLRALATGDSMVQPLDRQLARTVRKQGGTLKRDARDGTAISASRGLDWTRHARRQVKRHRPQATVMFIGANDGAHPMRTPTGPPVTCCRRAWIDAYAERVERMMRTYRRGGAGHVYWLTLPVPREKLRAQRFAAINVALAQAAAAVGDGVRLVDTVPAISPGERYRRTIRRGGRRVVIRERDGVHLTAAGARIVHRLVVRAMRADGLLR